MVENDYLRIHDFMLENEKKIKARIEELESRLKTVHFDEENNLSNDFEEESPYYSAAQESRDFFQSFIVSNDIKKLLEERKLFEQKKKEDRELLNIANKLYKEQEILLRKKEKEIYDLNVAFLSYNDEEIVEGKKNLESRRSEKDVILQEYEYLKNEIEALNNSINNSNSHINLNNELMSSLREEQKVLKQRKGKRSEYLNLEEIRKDMANLEERKFDLERLQEAMRAFEFGKTKEETKTETSKLSPTETTPGLIPLSPIPEEERAITAPEPEIEKSTSEISKPTEEPTVEKSDKKDWKLDGFKLDFIEKFGYAPSENERVLNNGYAGDYSALISHPREMHGPTDYSLRERVVIGIRNISSSISDSIRRISNRTFRSRRPVTESTELITVTDSRVR